MIILPPRQLKVLLLGDACIDSYTFGNVLKLNPEAPVPVFCPTRTIEKEGMAANVKNNLLALGAQVVFRHGKIGKKTRLICSKSGQHICRIDEDIFSEPILDIETNNFDLIVISDYNKGTIDYNTIDNICKKATVPVFVDTKKRKLEQFKNCFFKINELELENLITKGPNIIVTRGERGVIYNEKEYSSKKIDLVDVTGAGDTFLASLSFFYTIFKCMDQAIKIAMKASEITLKHLGVYSPTLKEINEYSSYRT